MIVATQPRCLVLTPYDVSLWPVWNSIETVLREQGVEPVVYQHQGTLQFQDGPPLIRDYDLVIADVTDGNPNVMLELGIAMASRKSVLPIVNRTQRTVPASLAGFLFLVYDASLQGNAQFLEQLRWWVGQRVRVNRGI